MIASGSAPHEACTSNDGEGFYVQPTVFTVVKESMRVYPEEIGRELGHAGLEAYTQTKAMHVNMGAEL